MLLRWTTACLLAAAILAANGCCSVPSCGVGPMGGACGGGDCGAGDCGAADCGSCGGDRHDSFAGHLGAALTCGSGCGELYWGEWMSDPPAACDPCDSCGNYTGPAGGYTAGPPAFTADEYHAFHWNPLQGLRHLWGYRFTDAGQDGGCSTCGSGEMGLEMEYAPGEYMETMPGEAEGDSRLKPPAVPEPTPDQPQPAGADDSSQGRQASRAAASQNLVQPAAYRQRLRR